MPEPPQAEEINILPEKYKHAAKILCETVDYDEAATNILRSTINPLCDDNFIKNLTIRRVPLAPVTQHRSATTLRSPCHMSPHPHTSCQSPRPEYNVKLSEDLTRTPCQAPFNSHLRTLTNSPRRASMSPNTSPISKTNDSPQWVLLDKSFERSSSPEVLHLCGSCDGEFNNISQLRIHALRCGEIRVQPQPKKRLQKKQTNQQRKRFQNQQNVQRRPAPNVPICINEFIPLPISCRRQLVLKKDSFLHSLGLVERSTCLKVPTETEPKITINSTAALKKLPFTQLPENFRLRNFSFQPSTRIEILNKDLICLNWTRVDNLCRALPKNYRKAKKSKSVLGAQALALKRSLNQPRLVVRRLSAREIQRAALGINTQELMKETPLRLFTRCQSRHKSRKPVPASRKPGPASKKKKITINGVTIRSTSTNPTSSLAFNRKEKCNVSLAPTIQKIPSCCLSDNSSEVVVQQQQQHVLHHDIVPPSPFVIAGTRRDDVPLAPTTQEIPSCGLPDSSSEVVVQQQHIQHHDIVPPSPFVIAGTRRVSSMNPVVVVTRLSPAEIAYLTSRRYHKPSVCAPVVRSSIPLWFEDNGVIVIDD